MSAAWNEGPDQGGTPADGGWTAEAVALDGGGGDEDQTQDHGFDIAVKPELYPGFDGERQQIKDAGWIESTPYNYEAEQDPTKVLRDWAGNATVYEWSGEEGDVGPASEELERELFGDPEKRSGSGIDFSTLAEIKVTQEGETRISPFYDFDKAGLHPAMRRNVELAGYKVPTPIQMYCLPAIINGHDVMGIAQTGSGKTAAYLIPILNHLMGKAKKLAAARPNPATYRPGLDAPARAEPLVVIVAPSRELGIQIFNEARKFCYRTMLRPCVIYGGGPIRGQLEQLSRGCDVLIATPGRLIDIMNRPNHLSLRRVKFMVLDEADEMLQDDWGEDLSRILSGDQDDGDIKYMMFSATFPKRLRDLAKEYLANDHCRLRVGRAGSSHGNIQQVISYMDPANKRKATVELLNSIPPGRTIIFVNRKLTADELDDFLYNLGLPCTSIHAGRTQMEREDAMRAFRGGECPILIATGVAARGIDVHNVNHVINYDLPTLDHGGIEEYVHRIGRTGRIGHRGLATSFYTDRDEPIASVLTRTLLETKQEIPDFLEMYIPEGEARENLKFEADSDFEEFTAGDGGDDGWGAGGDAGDSWDAPADGDAGGTGWGGGDDDANDVPVVGWS
ncbi:ATP-dependent RNA helicase [Sporothrix brasiliensis 5110]|uniref:RNA helicase n=1 Tax=Sporothrix brasiliensis 5110 TaxID=1398154 RepID=A0A0C2J376_9PEZI|nr:ATP-dependent RNA helicase [Sporothrix brasiliensis 5110]KIH91517.1 ATP-dependent RNA helicase [Sporothrix brasiliensis 5110]